jgi:hypothetical protein
MLYKIFRELPIVFAIALSGCAAIHAPTTEDQTRAQRQPTAPQNVLVVSATQRSTCSTCVPPTKLFVYSLKDSRNPTLMAGGSLKDLQGRSFEASRMRTDAQGNIFLLGGFLTYMEPSGLWQEKPGIAMLSARSLLSLDSFSTFDHDLKPSQWRIVASTVRRCLRHHVRVPVTVQADDGEALRTTLVYCWCPVVAVHKPRCGVRLAQMGANSV